MFGVRTPFLHLFFSNTSLPASKNFWTKIQLSKKSDAFLSANILLSLIIFFNLLYSISKTALPRYSRVSYKKLNGWEFVRWLTANLTFPLWRGKYCLTIFNALVMQYTTSRANCQHCFRFFWYVCLYAYPKRFFRGGGKAMLVFEIIYLFSDLQVIFYAQMTSIINSILL